MFEKIIIWLTEYFNSIEDAYLYTDDFVNGTHESFFDGADQVSIGQQVTAQTTRHR
jgi:hypothetical protein